MAKAMALETTFEDWKPLALDAAIEHLTRYGQISADDLHGLIEEPNHPSWWGALFKDPEFKKNAVWHGECKNSTRKGHQGSMIRIWRHKPLRGAA